MAIDTVGATLSATKLMASPAASARLTGMGVCLPMVSMKAMWQTQITGCYDLIYGQGLHLDFPTRQEVQQAIQMGYTMHTHEGNLGYPTSPGFGMGPMPIYIKDEMMYAKLTRTPPMASQATGALPTDEEPPETPGAPTQVFVRSKSAVQGIGYGV